MQKTYLTIGIVSLFVVGTIIYAFSLTGSPFDARGKQFDQTRVSHLTSLKSSIQSFYTSKDRLPNNLSELVSDYSYTNSYTKDPDSKKEYEYAKISETSYKLCATFSAPSETSARPTIYYDSDSERFDHQKGYQCFTLNVTSYKSTVYNYNTTKTILDTKIDSVTSNAKKITASNFPYGFFSLSTTEYGLINYADASVTVNIYFKDPVQLTSIANTFTNCPTTGCYSWSAKGLTDKDKTVSLVEETKTNAEISSVEPVTSKEKISVLKITATRLTGDKYVHWKKIKLTYGD